MTETATIVAVFVALLVALTALVLAAMQRRPRSRHPLIAQAVVVQLTDGSAVAGVLARRLGGFLVVENARLHEHGGEVPVDGSAWLPVDQVRWIQLTPYQDGGER